MKKSHLLLIPLAIFLIFILLVVIGTLTKDKTPDTNQNNIPPHINAGDADLSKGVSLSPISYSGNDFTNFFTKAKEAGSLISWAGNWEELKNKNSAPYVHMKLSSEYDYIPVIITSLPSSYSDDYVTTISNFAKENKPNYFGLGNEINTNYQESYSETFSKTYDEIKKVSPSTQVFTIFQLEKMKQKEDWNLISNFEKADFIAFTTYPIIIYQTPSKIPDNYYSEITQKTSKQIAFTEVGWQRKDNQQVEFIKKFSIISSSVNSKFKIWTFLYDQNTISPFNTMGLLQKNQETSESFEEWEKI
ncbi:hypothetical protein J4474_02730 [Candidatus Pacearchaeota archaeon]|nr:hypothetical protein [Candidatus Pacearchaeota archaeon]